jgi:PadR family transcriptional regulator PadR
MMIGTGIKRGTAELAVLSVLENGPLHGYEMARQIEEQTKGTLRFTLAALYPTLYKMEQREWIRGNWETSQNGRRRRCYKLTAAGKKKLSPMRKEWAELFRALRQLRKVSHA